jgi:hypothetical protein
MSKANHSKRCPRCRLHVGIAEPSPRSLHQPAQYDRAMVFACAWMISCGRLIVPGLMPEVGLMSLGGLEGDRRYLDVRGGGPQRSTG